MQKKDKKWKQQHFLFSTAMNFMRKKNKDTSI